MANIISSESAGGAKRRKEKEASAKLRGRKSFDDQSSVDKIYKWVKNVTKTKQVYDPSSKHLPYTR
jgi:hypothetical protein